MTDVTTAWRYARPAGWRGNAALVEAVSRLGGEVTIDPSPQEVTWSVPLDEDEQHRRYEPDQVAAYFRAATQAALALAAFRAPYRGRSTPVNAWWGSFDLAVSLFSGQAAEPPAADFITRNSMDAQEVAVGWWPGDARHPKAAFYAYAHPAPDGSQMRRCDLRPPTGTLPSANTSWTGTTSAPAPTRTQTRRVRPLSVPACVRRLRVGSAGWP